METREREKQTVTTGSSGEGRNGHVNEIEADSGAKRNMRPLLIAVGFVVAILIVIWGVRYFIYAGAHQSTDDARVDANTVAITSKISERVDQIAVQADQPVKKGQLLVVLDSADERARLDQAQANLQLALQNQQAGVAQGSGGVSQAQADVQNAAAQVPVAQAGVAAAQAQVQAARAAVPGAAQALAQAAANLRRTQTLVRSGDVARE
ncbi:MAG TPA: biotin/lipoyl-binding protein, partial [Candidatus Baltobacteraceae bacterium]|nr:biotin/lipoyl-binding protein [Candidatus Baltobacteraceae bacterium]